MPSDLVLPPRLPEGGTVGLVCPSSPTSQATVDRVRGFWEGMGFEVRLGAHLLAGLGGYLAGSAVDRAADFNSMMRAPDVDLVVPVMGGKGASHLLPLLDLKALSARPRLIIGQSDSSLLALALHAASRVVTFHGPTGMNVGRMPAFTRSGMVRALTDEAPIGDLPQHTRWRTLRGSGTVRGPLLGGHLRTIQALIGTPWEPRWDGALLFVEEIDCEFHDVDAALTHFRLAGILDRVAALIVGRPVNVAESWKPTSDVLEDVILRVTEDVDLPVVFDVDLGHTDETLTLPVGAEAVLDLDRPRLSLPMAVVS